jgi:hypothetical protein
MDAGTQLVTRGVGTTLYHGTAYVEATNGNATGSNRAVVTEPVKNYTVLDTPRSPWDVSDDYTVDDTNQPWVSALEFATAPTKGNASGQNDEGSLTEITNFLFRQSEDTDGDGTTDVFGHDLVYAARRGDPEYGYTGIAEAAYLGLVIDKSTPAEADSAISGDISDIIVVPYDLTRGLT